MTAHGRAPWATMSLKIPPTPVSAPERLDRAGVIMAFDLKRNGPAIAHIDDASMRARASECIFAIFG